jgi:N-acetylneuraminic acid mutarotase
MLRPHRIALATLAATALTLVGLGPAAPPDAESAQRGASDRGDWRARAAAPEARAETGVAALGRHVYVVGGTVVRGEQPPAYASTLLSRYDPRTNRWTQRAPLPRPLTHVALAAARGKLYAFGGFTQIIHLNPQQAAYEYDPREDRWSALPDLPEPLGSVGVAAVGGELHLVGGRNSVEVVEVPGVEPPLSQGFGTVRTHLVFDPKRRRWSRAAPLPGEPRDHVGVAAVGRDLHVFGGRVADVEDNLARHDVYDTRTRRWRTAAPLPTPRSAGAATVLGGRIVYAGGECKADAAVDPNGTYDDVTAYDPRTDRWTTLAPLPRARHAFGAGRVGGRAYFVGGALTCGGGASADMLELTLGR